MSRRTRKHHRQPTDTEHGGKLVAWRLAKGWSQRKLATVAGIRIPSLCQMEKNHQEMKLRHLERLVAALGITVHQFLHETPPPPLHDSDDEGGGGGEETALPDVKAAS